MLDSGHGFRFFSWEYLVWGVPCAMCLLCCGVWGLGFEVWVFGFGILGVESGVLGSGLGFWISCFRIRISRLWFTDSGF